MLYQAILNKRLGIGVLATAVVMCSLGHWVTAEEIRQVLAGRPESQQTLIGGYEIVTVGGVDVVRDPTGVVSYFNNSTGVRTCSSGWNKPTHMHTSLLGGVHVEFSHPGLYQFYYLLEPWYGTFAGLEGAQIIVLKDLDMDEIEPVYVEVRHHRIHIYRDHPYHPGTTFYIPEAGSYTIGFGPYNGTLLPSSLLHSGNLPNSTSIRFNLQSLDPIQNDGYQLRSFVDLSVEIDRQGGYKVRPIVKGRDFMPQGSPDENYVIALGQIKGIGDATIERLVEQYEYAGKAGYSNAHPFGKELLYAESKLFDLETVFTNADYAWNDKDIKQVTAVKTALYLWQLKGRTPQSLKAINDILARQDYGLIFNEIRALLKESFPIRFSDFQTVR